MGICGTEITSAIGPREKKRTNDVLRRSAVARS
jgi:hypothetical protein